MPTELVMPSNHLILCRPLLQPSVVPSIRVFPNELVLHIRWPKHCIFSFSISPSNEYSGLISFRIDWFNLLALEGTLKGLLQHQFENIHSLDSAFFMANSHICSQKGFLCVSAGTESACNAGDLGSIPGLGRSPGEGKGYPLQYSGLENSMDCIAHGVSKSQI